MKNYVLSALVVVISLNFPLLTTAFQIQNTACNINHNKLQHKASSRINSRIYMARNNRFDLSKPVFDLFALRSIRGDALLRYNTLNQSEPLRINLYGLLALTCFSFPLISESIGGDALGVVATAGSILAGLGSIVLFVQECQKRSKQLNRFEKELNCIDLKLRLPMNVLADMAFTDEASLQVLQKTSSPPRILAICASRDEMKNSLRTLNVLGKRLKQSSTFVVPIPTDGSTCEDWNIPTRLPWLAKAYDIDGWLQYFDDLSEGKSEASSSSDFRWFGLNTNGRSFGSGIGDAPEWLELMGQYLRPTVLLDENDSNFRVLDDEGDDVLKAQARFYENLIQGDLQGIREIFGNEDDVSKQVTNVIEKGGRIDNWESCLEEKARPVGMKVSGCDAIVVSNEQAFTTCIEFPADTNLSDVTPTLLAVQEWRKRDDTWQLLLHQTIPWTVQTRAQGTLRCDCRGCVALTRESERRTFGGIIG